MIETVTRKRIEILADTPLVSLITGHAHASGISGWSLIRVEGGGGRDGRWQRDDVTAAESKTIILMIASAKRAADLTDRLAGLLDSHRLLLTIGEVEVVRGARF